MGSTNVVFFIKVRFYYNSGEQPAWLIAVETDQPAENLRGIDRFGATSKTGQFRSDFARILGRLFHKVQINGYDICASEIIYEERPGLMRTHLLRQEFDKWRLYEILSTTV